MKTTTTQLAAALQCLAAISEAIRELGTVPNGILWTHLMSRMTFEDYQDAIQILKNCDVISEKENRLIWCGPQIEPKTDYPPFPHVHLQTIQPVWPLD